MGTADYWGLYLLLEKIDVDAARVAVQPLKPSTAADGISGGFVLSQCNVHRCK